LHPVFSIQCLASLTRFARSDDDHGLAALNSA
jgi:hypothetical protein